jgi:hypothetical protein
MHHDKELSDHGNFYQGQEARRRLDGKVAAHFPEEKAVLTIYDGPAPPPMSPKVSSNLPAVQSTS